MDGHDPARLRREIHGYGPDDALAWSTRLTEDQVRVLARFLDPGRDTDLVDVHPLVGPALEEAARLAGFAPRPDLDYVLDTSYAYLPGELDARRTGRG